MKSIAQNKMGTDSMGKLIMKMGLPMILSMVLQAVYNIVDTAFVVNMGENGLNGNLALTYAFPIQLLIIAAGVGTGVGINVILSKTLGEGDREKAGRITGNGIFLGLSIYLIFLIFGIFGSRSFIALQAAGNQEVVDMGTSYLTICSCLSFGAVGYTIYERFLQATGKTGFSTISQIVGAALNIILDYVFIFPCGMGVSGAACATVIGQIAALITAMAFHYFKNKEIVNRIKYLKPDFKIIKAIYSVGITAAIMQGLLSVMMFGVNLILGTSPIADLLQGAFGIYYKLQQFALFAAFGLSNTLISLISYNYGAGNSDRVKTGIVFGIIYSIALMLVITVLFESLASPLSELFGMTGGAASDDVKAVCVTAMRIASIGYVFMGFSVAAQGVLQAFGYALKPMIISLMRLCVFVFPVIYLLTISDNAQIVVWWAFPIAEVATALFAGLFLLTSYKRRVENQ